jgi:hypothetical protein
MANTLKVLSTEISLSNTVGNTVSSASLVRLVNTHVNYSEIIRVCYANGVVKATTTLGHKATDFAKLTLVKQPTDIILTTGLVDVKATSVAYS